MSFIELAKNRYACRSYQDRKVEKEKLELILEAGRIAPTAANLQPQRLIVVQEKEGLEKLNRCTRTFGAPLAIIVCSDRDVAWIRPYDRMNAAQIDASIITDHMMLAAKDSGLDSVWICYFKPDNLRKEFNIPEHYEPVNILMIGYGEGEPKSPDRHDSTRLPLENTVFYETF